CEDRDHGSTVGAVPKAGVTALLRFRETPVTPPPVGRGRTATVAADDLAASPRRGRGRIARRRAPADGEGGTSGAERRGGAGEARRRAGRVPDEPQGEGRGDGAPGVREPRRGAQARAQ